MDYSTRGVVSNLHEITVEVAVLCSVTTCKGEW